MVRKPTGRRMADASGPVQDDFAGDQRPAIVIADLRARLRESEARYARLLENLKDDFLFYRHDTRGRFTFASPSHRNILGYEPEEYLKLCADSQWTDNPINKEAARRTRLSMQGVRQPPYELEVRTKSGENRLFVNKETPIFDEKGNVLAVEGTARDITEKRRIEEKLEKYRKNLEELVEQRTAELRTSQKQLLDIIEFLPDPTYVVDRYEIIIAWNRAMVAMTGIEKGAVIGHPFHEFVAALYPPRHCLPVSRVLGNTDSSQPAAGTNGGTLFEELFLPGLYGGQGGYGWITTAPILDSDHQVAGAIESIRDVTLIKQAERLIRESERRLSTLMNNLPGMAYRIIQDEQGWIVEFVSQGCRQIFEYEPERFIRQPLTALKGLIHPDDLGRVIRQIRGALREPSPVQCEYRILTAGGDTKWVFDKAEVVVNPLDGALSIEGFMADFTLYKTMEQRLKEENLLLRSTMRDRSKLSDIIGNCPAMQEVYDLILKAATTEDNVFILGESGTGKELVAQAIHNFSNRKDKNFVTVNCSAIPEHLIESEFFGACKGAFTGAVVDKKGYLETADGGTLFLDEIGDISLSLQVKLLRAIDGGGFSPVGSRRVIRPNFRIIAASNKDLEQLVAGGAIRQDFFFRVHVIPIHLPPLRDRGDDLFILINHFLKRYSSSDSITTLSRDDLAALRGYHWPGNVRELQNVLKRYIALKNLHFMKLPHKTETPATVVDNGVPLTEEHSLRGAVDQFEKNIILKTLNQTKWNKTRAARELGISRKTLFRRMKAAGL